MRVLVVAAAALFASACADDGSSDGNGDDSTSTAGDGDGDGAETGGGSGDGDGDGDLSCVSGTYWTQGNHESPLMHPGNDCLGCHSSMNEVPWVVLAGTVYTAAHEEDDCNGVPGVTVKIVDANGAEFETVSNAAGNFLLESVAITPPYSASLEWEGRTREMVGMQSVISCNSCHTQTGDQAAHGRILAP